MRDFAEVFGDEPCRFFGGHPVQTIESRQVHWTRIASQGAFAAQVEVDVEVTHGQLAQAAVNRLAIAAAGEIGFRHRAPVPAHFEDRDDMIGVLFRFQIENQWRKSQNAERSRGEDSALETSCDTVVQDSFRGARGVTDIVRQVVEKFLYAGRRF